MVASATVLISGWLSPTFAKDEGDLGKRIAGTYLAVQDDAAQTLQISEDGNLSFIPGVNPFDPDAEPIPGGEFDCGGVIDFIASLFKRDSPRLDSGHVPQPVCS